MRFISDENISPVIGDALRKNGHDVVAAAVVCPGRSDRHVVQVAQVEQRTVIGEDKDFGELAFRDGVFPIGLIRVALPGTAPTEKAIRLLDVLAQQSGQILGNLIVIEAMRIRVRPL